MDRREFLSWTGVGLLATSLPVAIAACSAKEASIEAETSTGTTATPDSASTEVASGDGFIDIGANASGVTDSSSVGVTDTKVVPEKVIVIRNPADPSALLALTSNCNHRDCTVDWNASNQEFVCPCHQSRFGVDGSILAGPATQALRPLQVRVAADDSIEVKF